MLSAALPLSTTTIALGVGGTTFFSPVFILALRLPPNAAIRRVLRIIIFAVAGVILGLQLRSRRARSISQSVFERRLRIVCILVAALTLAEIIL